MALASLGGLIALVRLQAKTHELSKQQDISLQNIERIERESMKVVTLVAEMEMAKRNWSELWQKLDHLEMKAEQADAAIHDKLERHRDRMDERILYLRDKLRNGHQSE